MLLYMCFLCSSGNVSNACLFDVHISRQTVCQHDIFHWHADGFYVTWGASEGAGMAPGQALPPHGKPLGRLDVADLNEVIQKVRNERLFTAIVCSCESHIFSK